MATTQYAIFLRGINVGGNNLIKMIDLKSCLDKAGLTNVATYIQSGNVLFDAKEAAHTKLLPTIAYGNAGKGKPIPSRATSAGPRFAANEKIARYPPDDES